MSLNVLKNVNLSEYTSWLIGGDADLFCLPTTIDELKEALSFARNQSLPITILGGGSNVLISDQGVEGLTICLRRFSKIEHQVSNGKIHIKCLAGTSKSELLKIFLKHQLEPALFLAGLPGDVGGGVIMNAGVAESFKPREFMELVDRITLISTDGDLSKKEKSELKISYRHTDGWQPHIVMEVEISWPYTPMADMLQRVKDANRVRLSKQPLDLPSCGSVFKNPEGYKVAQLIDQCGLKGLRFGDAQVSIKHANFIVNLDKATASDTWKLINHVAQVVFDKTGVEIRTEVIRLGRW
jgi:UDP-N-acetylmuramate dehydrogenase